MKRKTLRICYKERYPKQAKACDGWDDATFLDRAKLTSGGNSCIGGYRVFLVAIESYDP